jgi:hypothetical protein
MAEAIGVLSPRPRCEEVLAGKSKQQCVDFLSVDFIGEPKNGCTDELLSCDGRTLEH